eukprot:EC721661.1.p3 GENE.EC721661.1~~EC721661.1.p3  ORF type:complete len:60 (-),score=4.73 EC721661.1:169-348(-)
MPISATAQQTNHLRNLLAGGHFECVCMMSNYVGTGYTHMLELCFRNLHIIINVFHNFWL